MNRKTNQYNWIKSQVPLSFGKWQKGHLKQCGNEELFNTCYEGNGLVKCIKRKKINAMPHFTQK